MNKPFLLRPSGKDYLWGGNRLNDEFGKNVELSPLAETWECSTNEACPSYVASGVYAGLTLGEVIFKHPELMGSKHKNADKFPILVKIIDAKSDLSVQVHPGDKYANDYEHGQMGKTEMWYVLDAQKNSKLFYGFCHDVDRDTVKSAVEEGSLLNHLQQVSVNKGDLFYIEPGTVHAIGAGTLVAEIQENSDVTYRLYDYDRIDKNGKKRELHVDKALDVLNYEKADEPKQPIRLMKYRQGVASELICRCHFFEVYRMIVNTERRQTVHYRADASCFRVLLCVNGCGSLSYGNETTLFYKGDCVFVPADSEVVSIHGQAQFLDVRG